MNENNLVNMSAEERLPLQGNYGVSFKSPFFEPSTKRPKQVSSLNTSSGEGQSISCFINKFKG